MTRRKFIREFKTEAVRLVTYEEDQFPDVWGRSGGSSRP